jgi:dipeptidyl-peptidase 4
MRSRRQRRIWLAIALLSLAASPARAQKKKLSLEDLTADPPLSGRVATGLAWLPSGTHFSFIVRKGSGEDPPSDLVVEDAKTGTRRTVIKAEGLALPEEPEQEIAAGVQKQPPRSEAAAGTPRGPCRARRVSLEGYRWSPDGGSLLLCGDSDLWLYRVAEGRLERLTHDKEIEEFPMFSPDGRRVAFVRKNDLYLLDLESKTESRLTSDGGEHVFNGRLDWVYEEELASRTGRAYEWAPDSSSLAYLHLDESRVDSYPIVDFLKVPAAVTFQRYPKSGTANSTVSFRVVGTDGSDRGHVEPEGDVYIEPAFSWTRDSRSVCYRVLNRAQDRQEVRLLSVGSSASRTLFVEEDPYWLNVTEPPKFLKDGRYLWKSERSGFMHLYVGNVSGGADDSPRAITSGRWMVDRVAGVDEAKKLVYFTATEESPRRRAVYRVSLDGKGFAKLPLPPGTHAADLSPDGLYLLDTFSSISTPPVVTLLDAAGKSLRVVDRPENRLSGFELATSQEMEVRADDGATLLARLVKPSDFDASKKYPVIVYLYGGPHGQVVRDSWGATSLFDHYMASRGFLVWSLDNRGSWGRGHAWETALFKETGKKELADQLAGVKYLNSLPFVDPVRVGIWGWSYGGYMTLYALTNAPEVWKCGIAGAPVTHWKFYDTIYTERYMRTPKENPRGYEASAPLSKAKDLKARLLLIHGTADDNVHMQNTLAFVDALTKASRPYQLEIQPGQKHGFRGRESLNFRNAAMAKFFEENL